MTTTAPDTSTAEWIAEAPSECSSGDLQQCTPLPLTDFGTIQFHNADATAGGHTGSISAWSHEAISLSPNDGEFLGGGYGGYGAVDTSYAASSGGGASPSSLKSGGTAFTITYGTQATSSSSAGRHRWGLQMATCGGSSPPPASRVWCSTLCSRLLAVHPRRRMPSGSTPPTSPPCARTARSWTA